MVAAEMAKSGQFAVSHWGKRTERELLIKNLKQYSQSIYLLSELEIGKICKLLLPCIHRHPTRRNRMSTQTLSTPVSHFKNIPGDAAPVAHVQQESLLQKVFALWVKPYENMSVLGLGL
jgi:hypothetical protein